MPDPAVTPIHHIASVVEWEAARQRGSYRRSTRDQSLEEVGFIHCSTAAQWRDTLARFYSDCPDELVLLTIDPQRVPAEIRVEGGFPHIYGPLPTDAVIAVEPLR